MEVHARRPQGEKHSAYTFPEHTQGESHSQCIVNTTDDLSLSHMHLQARRTTRQHLFVDCIMEADIPLAWKPLNLERYDGTTYSDEHLDAFLTQTNLYTNNDAILCHVFPLSFKEETLTWYGGLPPKSIDSFDTLIERFNVKYTTNRFHRMTLASLRQADKESLRKFMDRFWCTTVQIQNLNLEVALHSMLLALHLGMFVDSLCLKSL